MRKIITQGLFIALFTMIANIVMAQTAYIKAEINGNVYRDPANICSSASVLTGTQLVAEVSGGSGLTYKWERRNRSNPSRWEQYTVATQRWMHPPTLQDGDEVRCDITSNTPFTGTSITYTHAEIHITVSPVPTVQPIAYPSGYPLYLSTSYLLTCVGSTVQLNDSTPNGVWSIYDASDYASVGTINSTGLVTAITGNSPLMIEYTVTNTAGCSTIAKQGIHIQNNPLVDTIKGDTSVYVGWADTLHESITGGAWSSGDTTKATVDNSGIVTGRDTGRVNVTYTFTNAYGSRSTHIGLFGSNPPAPSITSFAPTSACVGATIVITGKYFTTASAISIGSTPITTFTINSDTKITATIPYTPTNITDTIKVTNATGSTGKSTTKFTIYALPTVAAISGASAVCVNDTIHLTDATTGGVWKSRNTAKATVSTSGVVTAGVDPTNPSPVISYTVTNVYGCVDSATVTININALPTPTITAGSSTTFCQGDSVTLSSSLASSYLWNDASNSTTKNLKVKTGGSYTVRVTNANNCKATSSATTIIVNALPVVAPITGKDSVCVGATNYSLNDDTIGGRWSSTNTAIDTIRPVLGYVTGISAGKDTINYKVTNATTGCSTTVMVAFVVDSLPVVPPIMGVSSVCVGDTNTLTDADTSGIWTSDNRDSLRINRHTAFIRGLIAGSTIINYTITNSYGCKGVAMDTIIVNPLPYISHISGLSTVCQGSSITLTDSASGGSWTSNRPVNAPISSGVLTGVNPTNATIKYTVTSDSGCVASVTKLDTVLATSTSTITASICNGSSYTFNGTTYTTSGTYTFDSLNKVGCDSLTTLVLTIKQPSSSTTSISICPSALPYSWNGLSFTGAGTQTAHLTNAVGCDSAATLVLTVKAASSSTTNDTIYAGGSFTFNGSSYTTAGTYTAHLTNSLGCDSAAILHLTVVSSITWTGATNTDWGTATNWSPVGVPADNSNITIPSTTTNKPSLISNSYAIVDTLTLGGTITFNGNTLTVNGPVSGSGTLVCDSNASLTIGGTSSPTLYFNQSTPGVTNLLGYLTVNTTGTVTLGNPLNIVGGIYPGIVTVSAGTLNANGNLTLLSDTFGTARIAQSSGAITGNVTVQRFIPAKTQRVFELIGSAVGPMALDSAWHKQIYITGAGSGGSQCTGVMNSNGFDFTESADPSMYVYAPFIPSGSSNHWASIPNTHINITPGVGYKLNIRGSKNNGNLTNIQYACYDQLATSTPAPPDSVTLSATGTVAQGDVTDTLNSHWFGGSSYTLVANPYPCPIDFFAFLDSNSTCINNKFWVWSTTDTSILHSYTYGKYTTYNAGIFSNLPPSYTPTTFMESGQAFFVQSFDTATISTRGSTSVTFKESHKTTHTPNNIQFFGITEKPKLIRVALQTTNSNQLDEVVVLFNKYGTKTFNSKLDAESLNSGNQVLVTNKGNTALAIATHPEDFVTDTAQLGALIKTVGTFQLSFREFESMNDTTSIELRDKYLGVAQDIRTNPIYKFNVTSDATSQGNNRFELVFGAKKASGKKLTVSSKQLVVFPNPLTSNSFSLNLGDAVIGKYTIRIVNVMGQTIYSTTISHNVLNALESVFLNKKLAGGSYIVTATAIDGTVSKTQVMVK